MLGASFSKSHVSPHRPHWTEGSLKRKLSLLFSLPPPPWSNLGRSRGSNSLLTTDWYVDWRVWIHESLCFQKPSGIQTLFSCQDTLAKQNLGLSKPHPSPNSTGLQATQRSKVRCVAGEGVWGGGNEQGGSQLTPETLHQNVLIWIILIGCINPIPLNCFSPGRGFRARPGAPKFKSDGLSKVQILYNHLLKQYMSKPLLEPLLIILKKLLRGEKKKHYKT